MKQDNRPIHQYRKNFDSCGGPLTKNKRSLPRITYVDQLMCLRYLLIRLQKTKMFEEFYEFMVDNDDTMSHLVKDKKNNPQFLETSGEIKEYLQFLKGLKPMLLLYEGAWNKTKDPAELLLFNIILDRLPIIRSSLISAFHKIAVKGLRW